MRTDKVDALLADAGRLADCREKRAAWARETSAALAAAQREMHERCTEAVDRLSEEAFDRLFNEEQAKVCRYLDPLRAAAEEDRWPRRLYFGEI